MLARWPSRHAILSSIRTIPVRKRHSTMLQPEGQAFERLLVLDFEATCDNQPGTIKPQEVIEFPVLCLDVTQHYQLTAKFHRYVKPEVHPQLTPFCTKLTGIIQDMVDDEEPLPAVLKDFHQWLEKEGLFTKSFAFVTCGDWDLRDLLPNQCRYLGLEVPHYFKSWINMKMIFAEATGVYPRNLPHMMAHFNLPQLGRLHSGIDDCTNIAAVVRRLRLQPGCVWHLTSFAQD